MDDEQKIDMVLEWAESRPNFDTEFIHSLKEALDEYDELTYSQSEALDNIIKKFRIKSKYD